MQNSLKRPWLRFIEGPGDGPGENQATPPANQETQTPPPSEERADDGEQDWKSKFEAMREHSRTWEKRAKANQDAAKRLEEIEEHGKTELEKATDRIRGLEDELAASRQSELRATIASEFQLTADDRDLYLTGGDEETMRKQAEGLRARRGPENPHQGRGDSGGAGKTVAKDWAKQLLGK